MTKSDGMAWQWTQDLSIDPDIEEWYIVWLYGTWDALNSISVLSDTRNLATNPQDVAAVLNQRFPSLDRTPQV